MTGHKKIHAAITGRTPRLAMIGCGAVAEIFYLPALSAYPSVLENMVLADPSEKRFGHIAEKYNVRHHVSGHQELFDREIDGVIITAPSHLHHPIAMDFLERKIPVLCEKPLAVTADHAREMVGKAAEKGVSLLTNYQRRLYGSYIKVKEMLEDRILGKPLSFYYSEGQKYSWPVVTASRFDTKLSSRGVLLDRGAHVLDTACWWLGGKPRLISSQNDSFGGCEAVSHVRFELDGCIGDIHLSLLGKRPCIFRVKCEEGTLEGDIYDFRSVLITDKAGKKKRLHVKTREKSYTDFGHTIVANFLDMVVNDAPPAVPGAAVIDCVEWIDECYAAATRFDMPWYNILEK